MVISDKKRSSFISYSYISSLLSKFYAKNKEYAGTHILYFM